jgi:hypothetical protein
VGYSRSRHAVAFLLLGLALDGCSPAPNSGPVRLQSEMREGRRVLAVIPAAGFRINAHVPPALELGSGEIIRLAAGRVLPDSSYFVEPPWGPRPDARPLRGVLRVSFCRVDEQLCRTTTLAIDLHD